MRESLRVNWEQGPEMGFSQIKKPMNVRSSSIVCEKQNWSDITLIIKSNHVYNRIKYNYKIFSNFWIHEAIKVKLNVILTIHCIASQLENYWM